MMTLKTWRTDKKISQGTIAKMTGVSRPHISDIETGRRYPSRLVALKIEQATFGAVTKESLLYPEASRTG